MKKPKKRKLSRKSLRHLKNRLMIKQRYKPYDATNGFTVITRSDSYTILCNDCNEKVKVLYYKDSVEDAYVEINGVLLNLDTAERLFSSLFKSIRSKLKIQK